MLRQCALLLVLFCAAAASASSSITQVSSEGTLVKIFDLMHGYSASLEDASIAILESKALALRTCMDIQELPEFKAVAGQGMYATRKRGVFVVPLRVFNSKMIIEQLNDEYSRATYMFEDIKGYGIVFEYRTKDQAFAEFLETHIQNQIEEFPEELIYDLPQLLGLLKVAEKHSWKSCSTEEL